MKLHLEGEWLRGFGSSWLLAVDSTTDQPRVGTSAKAFIAPQEVSPKFYKHSGLWKDVRRPQ